MARGAERDEQFAAAEAAWRGVAVDRGAFELHLGSLGVDADSLAADRLSDLLLAFACAQRTPAGLAAVAVLEATHFPALRRSLARVDPSPAFADDVLQELRAKLVSIGGEPAAILDYAGRATLRRWLLAAAMRTALNQRRGKGSAPYDSISPDLPAASEGPELAVLRARCKADFRAALYAAIDALPERERGLLHLHLTEKMSIDGLARVHRIGRSTAARWLSAARAALFEATREQLCSRLAITPAEFLSIAAMVRSELDVSLAAHLAPDGRRAS